MLWNPHWKGVSKDSFAIEELSNSFLHFEACITALRDWHWNTSASLLTLVYFCPSSFGLIPPFPEPSGHFFPYFECPQYLCEENNISYGQVRFNASQSGNQQYCFREWVVPFWNTEDISRHIGLKIHRGFEGFQEGRGLLRECTVGRPEALALPSSSDSLALKTSELWSKQG